jgi:glutathione synthase
MRLGILTNDVHELQGQFATTRLCYTALDQGHDVHVLSVGDVYYDPSERIRALGRRPPRTRYRSGDAYLQDLRGPDGIVEDLFVDELDVLLLRENPGKDAARPWAQSAGIMFGRLAARRGVVVVNDPDGLSRANSKMYLQEFPEQVRPRTLITRDRDRLRQFAVDEGRPLVLKPLLGSGGKNVFLVRPEDLSNINQIIEVISAEGYVIAQEYLPAAVQGDTRLLLMNGVPFKYHRKYAAFRRVRIGGDLRSNLSAGGTLAQARVTDEMLEVAEICRPRLVEDGIFLAGLDVVGDKLMEINVFSPGGIGSAQRFEKVNFAAGILEALERKVELMRRYRRGIDNRLIAML